MLCHNVHRYLAEIEIGANPCRGRDAGCLDHIQNNLSGKFTGRQLVGGKVVGHIYEHLIDGVDNNILRGNVFQVDLVDPGAVFHVIGHPRWCDDKVNLHLRVFLQFREEVGLALQHSAGSIMPTSNICFLDSLLDFKEPSTPGDAIRL